MGSASRVAKLKLRESLDQATADVTLEVASELLAAARLLDAQPQLRSAVANPLAEPAVKHALIRQVFGAGFQQTTLNLVNAVAALRWSSAHDVVDALEDLGVRSVAMCATGADVAQELLAVRAAVVSDNELELSLGSALGVADAKVFLARRLLSGKASAGTEAIVTHLVAVPRGRRIGEMLLGAARVVADQLGFALATVTAAKPLSAAQQQRLAAGLTSSYGRPVRINLVLDPSVVGGLHVQVGDEVIDGTVSTRLASLRRSLAS